MRNGHVTTLVPSRELCGTTPEQFADLVARLAPAVDAAWAARADIPGRKRKLGGGDRPYAFWFRLFVTLTHLRQNMSVRATAAIFGIHEKSVRRYRDEITALLADHGCVPVGWTEPLRSLDDLREHLEVLAEQDEYAIVDGTEVPRSSPLDWKEQVAAWSGKSKNHVVKGTIVAGRDRRPLWFEANPSGEGRTHDTAMLRQQFTLLTTLMLTSTVLLADLGYSGLHDEFGNRLLTPWKRKANQHLADGDRRCNNVLSGLRMPVEHAIGRMKWWRVMREWRRSPEHFDTTGKAVAALASMT